MTNHPNRSSAARERNARFLFLMNKVLPNHWAHTPDESAKRDLADLPADLQKQLMDTLERIHNSLALVR